jgi:hypothetical protein
MRPWLDNELATCRFADKRLEKRFKNLAEQLSEGMGESIPMACADWSATKAAYRFLSNERVSEQEILSGHFHATQERVRASAGTILVLHDTTEFTFKRDEPDLIGNTVVIPGRRHINGKPERRTVCGILMHSSLVVTLEGLPLGIAAIKFWNRKEFKGTNALKKKINPTRVPIEEKESIRWLENLKQSTRLLGEPERCVHIGDRESDIYELFCTAQEAKTHFLVRTCVDRLAEDGTSTISKEMKVVPVQAVHRILVRDKQGNPSEATLELRYRRLRVLPPIGKQNRYPELMLTVIYAQERGTPQGRDPVDWKLLTDLPVNSKAAAIDKLNWYASRWKIETYHKVLKSGCKAEESKLRTAERLVNLLSVYCILAWRIFWMTMLNRTTTEMSVTSVFSETERQLLDHLVPDRGIDDTKRPLSDYIIKVARLGGYLARSNDSPPGNIVMWRGMSRLTDIVLGFEAAKDVGN